MERLVTEKYIFDRRLHDKPIMIVESNSTKEQRDECKETLWRTGIYRPMLEDESGRNAVVTHCVRFRTYFRLENRYNTQREGDMFRIPDNEWQRRYADWCLKINK